MRFCETRGLIDRQSFVAQYISLAMLSIGEFEFSVRPFSFEWSLTILSLSSSFIGVTTLLGSDDLLAAFACGTAFAWE